MGLNKETEILIFVFALSSIAVIIACYRRYKKIKLPPGPYGLPIIGYVPFLRRNDICLQFSQLGKKYGPIFSIKLGKQLCILLSSSEAIKEAFVKSELAARPKFHFQEFYKYPRVLSAHDEVWIQHRRFLALCLGKLISGRSVLQDYIIDNVEDLVSSLINESGNPVDIRDELSAFISKVSSQTCFGKLLNPECKRILKEENEFIMEILMKSLIDTCCPRLLKIFIAGANNIKLRETIQRFEKTSAAVIWNQVDEQKVSDTFSQSCILHMYLDEIKNNGKGSRFNLNEIYLIPFIKSVYQAGLATIMNLEWCFYIVAAKPDIQLKVQNEIDEIIGREAVPKFSDQRNMPYTHSVLLEVQRLYPAATISLPKRVLKDTNIMGYKIPKDTIVIANFYEIHHAENSWENPNVFLPERFHNLRNSNSVKTRDNIFPFSYGRRNCPGENLAQMEIFLCFVYILQKFDIRPADGKSIDLDGIMNAFLMPKQQSLCFVRRKA